MEEERAAGNNSSAVGRLKRGWLSGSGTVSTRVGVGGGGSKEGIRKGLVIFRPRENPLKVEGVSNQEERYW